MKVRILFSPVGVLERRHGGFGAGVHLNIQSRAITLVRLKFEII
jgi:hypothetical protein